MNSNISRNDKTILTDRAIGCLLGLAVGDAFGDIGRNDAYRQRFGIITNLSGYINPDSSNLYTRTYESDIRFS